MTGNSDEAMVETRPEGSPQGPLSGEASVEAPLLGIGHALAKPMLSAELARVVSAALDESG